MKKGWFSTHLSPRRLGLLFLLDQKQKQKNQDWLMQHTKAAPTSQKPVKATLLFISDLNLNLQVFES